MVNWEAVHECEDARDAECIHKQAQMTKASHVMEHTSVIEDDLEISIEKASQKNSFQIDSMSQILENSNWFSGSHTSSYNAC